MLKTNPITHCRPCDTTCQATQTRHACKEITPDPISTQVQSLPVICRKIRTAVSSSIYDSPLKSSLSIPRPQPLLMKRIWSVVASILNVGLGLMLYWTNNSLFAISFFVGIIRDDDVAYSIKKIKIIWQTQPFNTAVVGSLGSIFGFGGSVLSLPVTIAVGSILYGANLGASMSKKAQEILQSTQLQQQTP